MKEEYLALAVTGHAQACRCAYSTVICCGSTPDMPVAFWWHQVAFCLCHTHAHFACATHAQMVFLIITHSEGMHTQGDFFSDKAQEYREVSRMEGAMRPTAGQCLACRCLLEGRRQMA